MILSQIKWWIKFGVKRGFIKHRDLQTLHVLINKLQWGVYFDKKTD